MRPKIVISGAGIAGATLANLVEVPGHDAVSIYNEPGIATVLHPGRDAPIAMFLFQAAERIDPRDLGAQREAVCGATRAPGGVRPNWRANSRRPMMSISMR
jgi:2-polyprenyl-6-methoxyphenol hydroxylase-like FAD-dependent oxidoreductase